LETVGQAITGFAEGAYSWPFDYARQGGKI